MTIVAKDNDGLLLVSLDEETLLQINDYNIDFESAMIEGNIEEILHDTRIKNICSSGKAITCPHESECEILEDLDKGFVKIRIISGEKSGLVGYVFTRQIQFRRDAKSL